MIRRLTTLERLCLLYLGLLALAWGLAERFGEASLPTALLAYAPPILLMWPAGLLLLAALWRPQRAALPLALLACLAALAYGGLSLHPPQPASGLRLLSYNVARGGLGSPAQLAAEIRAADPDVVALQEVNGLRDPATGPGFLVELASQLPGYRLVRAREVATFSRLPMTASRAIGLPNNRALLEVRLHWQGRQVRVVNVHLGTISFSGVLNGRFARTAALRATALNTLMSLAEAEPGPLVLVGDFNTPPRGPEYQRLNRHAPDAFEQSGLGFGWSFPARAPLWRIDHLFSRDLTAQRAELRPAGGSDHRALLVVLR